MLEQIKREASQAVGELLEQAQLRPGDLFVVGCSTSEVTGTRIGKGGSLEVAQALFDGIYPLLQERELALAAQCCEHLNRALVVEAETAARQGLEPVAVVPRHNAGGSFATTAFGRFAQPVVVESIRARAGIDIGGTLIGMHIIPVAVPVRVSLQKIGQAGIILARSRPRYIGGSRAVYDVE